jgi:hypothetical protein
MLDSIMEIESYLGISRLFICKKVITITNDYLDYFKKVVTNFNEKDVKKEKEFTDKFCASYYGK